MSNTELIEELRRGDGNGCKRPNELMSRAADALEAAEKAITQLHRAWATDAGELAAAQAVIAEALACLEDADQGDSFGPIEDILSRSRVQP